MNWTNDNIHWPAEWHTQSAVWSAWPSHEDLWLDNYGAAVQEFTAFCQAISKGGAKLKLACLNDKKLNEAQSQLDNIHAEFHVLRYGDIWFRDTLPVFLLSNSSTHALRFRFNGWGDKYELPGDQSIGDEILKLEDIPFDRYNLILEGGSVEGNGQGIILTTEQCLLNPNRNSNLSKQQIENELLRAFRSNLVLWFRQGLLNDHTDGHIDTIARFSDAKTILIMEPAGTLDPNATVFKEIEDDAKSFKNNQGEPFNVVKIPSPGEILSSEGILMPASYLNFLITNHMVIVPVYGVNQDEKALHALTTVFPKHNVVGIQAKALLEGGGAFHCITQQIPEGAK